MRQIFISIAKYWILWVLLNSVSTVPTTRTLTIESLVGAVGALFSNTGILLHEHGMLTIPDAMAEYSITQYSSLQIVIFSPY